MWRRGSCERSSRSGREEQETVNARVKQSKELEAIHHKLEESHQMLTQMFVPRAWREDQDSEAPETRPTAYSSLT